MTIEKLLEIGDYLQGVDCVQEHNFMGFNKVDYPRWGFIRGLESQMKHMLKKYKRQITEVFGADFYDSIDWETPVKLVGSLDERFGSLNFTLDGFTKKFKEMKAVMSDVGLVWKGQNDYYMHRKHFSNFDSDKFIADMALLDITVVDIPELPINGEQKEIVQREMTYQEAVEGIKNKRVKNTITLGYDDGVFSFLYSFNRDLNTFFNNRKGNVTGIFECSESNNWARRTAEVDLVVETLEKLQKDFSYVKMIKQEGMDKIIKDRQDALEVSRRPIPQIQAIINPDYSLFPYQNEGTRFIDTHKGNVLLGDEMGLGKTLQALAYIAGRKKRALIVAPKTIRRKWIMEAHKFFPGYFVGKELRPKKDEKDLSKFNIVCVNPATLEKWIPEILAGGFDTLVFDESQYIKNPKAKITNMINSIAPNFKHKILLSGTAVKNKKEELHTQVELIAPGLLGTRNQLKYATIGGTWLNMRHVYLARQKARVLTELPDKNTSILELEMGNDLPGVKVLVNGTKEKKQRVPAFEEIARFKAEQAICKTKHTTEFVKELLKEGDENIVVYSDSVEAAKDIQRALGDKIAVLHHGQMSDDKREQIKYDFQEQGKYRVFVTTRQSIAVGADLYRASIAVFNDLPWGPADVRQAEDRLHRIGQKNNVQIYWITASDNDFDNKISNIIFIKYELSKKLNEGKQLTEKEREWMNKPVSLEEIFGKKSA